MWRAFLIGVLIWIAGTITIRLWGQQFLGPNRTSQTLLLYIISFIAMMLMVRGIFHWLALEKKSWVCAASLLILPTLILDPLSCLFFAPVFPNIDPVAAGAFGGWMLTCCGGAIVGALVKS